MVFNDNESFDLFEEMENIKKNLETKSNEDLYNEISEKFGIDFRKMEDDMVTSMQKVDLPYSSESDLDLNYNYVSDSGFDLYSTQDILIEGFGRALIPTGVRFEIPEGFEIQVRSKSGLALKQGLMVLNSPGTVDEGYTGEVQVIIFNTNKDQFQITKGMKIAQAVLSKCYPGRNVTLVKVNKIENKDRGENGFGSTGI
jgi:dUTP pyrophosphatase